MTKYKYLIFFSLHLLCNLAIAKVPCDPESFQFVNAPDRIDVTKPQTFKIKNDEEIGCAINVMYIWEFFRTDGKTLIPVREKVLKNDQITTELTNVLDLRTLAKTEDLYDSSFAIRVTLIPKTAHYKSYRLHFINVAKEEYVIRISGGPERNYTIGEGNFWLNATVERESGRSVDITNILWSCSPPIANDVYTKRLKWRVSDMFLKPNTRYKCKIEIDTQRQYRLIDEQIINVFPGGDMPFIDIKCVENCNSSVVYKPTVFSYDCYGKCDKTPEWYVEPDDDDIQSKLIIKNNTMTIPADTLDFSKLYKVTVFIGGGRDSMYLSLSPSRSGLKIKCIENCYNRRKQMKFQVECTKNCEKQMLYHWEIDLYPKNWNWSHFNYSVDNDIMYIPAYSLPPGGGAKLLAKTISSYTYFSFKVNGSAPTMKIICLKNCNISFYDRPVKLQAICVSDCEDINTVNWRVEPIISGVHFEGDVPLKDAELIIPANSVKPNAKLRVSVLTDEGELGAYIDLKYVSLPNISIKCIKNCIESETSIHEVTLLKAECSHCPEDVNFVWELHPPPNDEIRIRSVETQHGNYFLIPANSYGSLQTVNVTLKTAGAIADYTLKYRAPTPRLELYCIENCLPYKNPKMDMKLQVVCTQFCQDINYIWTLTPKIDLWHDKIELSPRNRTIIIKKNTYKANDRVKVVVNSYPYQSGAAYSFRYGVSKPELFLECIENCDNSWIHLPASFKATCLANCEDVEYSWKFTPQPKYFKWERHMEFSYTNSVLTIRPFSFKDSDRILLTVESHGGSNASINVTFEQLAPVLKFVCNPRPCDRHQNSKEAVSIKVECLANCENVPYNWLLKPLPKGFEWDRHIIRGIKNVSLTILPDVFDNGANINVSAWAPKAFIHTILKFRRPSPEFEIYCIFNCNHSNPHEAVHLEAVCDWLCNYIDHYEWKFSSTGRLSTSELWHVLGVSPNKKQISIPPGVYKDGDIINVTAYWGNVSKTLRVAFLEPKPDLTIDCMRNCDYNLMRQTVFEVNCNANCIVPYPYTWTVTNGKIPPEFYNNKKAMVFSAYSYERYERVNITACKGKSCVTLFVTFNLPESKLKIICIENCENGEANPKLRTKFEVICVEKCEPEMNYTWTIDQKPTNFKNSDLTLYRQNQTMTIRADLFLSGTCVLVKASAGGGTASFKVCYVQPDPVFEIKCIENCKIANPTREVRLNVTCYNHCYNMSIAWKMTPWVRDFQWDTHIKLSKNNVTLVLKKNTFQDGESVLFIASIGPYDSEYLIEFYTPPPVLILHCHPTCIGASPFEPVTIIVKCLQYCSHLNYDWNISPTPEGFIWSINMTTSDDNETLTIKEGTYRNKSVVLVSVTSNKSSRAEIKVTYHASPPILILSCVENCDYNPKLPVILSLSCKGECDGFEGNANCKLSPPVYGDKRLEFKQLFLIIKEYSYENGDTVIVKCTGNNVYTELKIIFYYPSHLGQCLISPMKGVGGITEHTIECMDFEKNSSFHVYQYIYGWTDFGRGMKLINSNSSYIPQILIAPQYEPGYVIIKIIVGEPWNVVRRISLNVSVEPFIYNSFTFRANLDEEQNKQLKELEVEQRIKFKMEELKELAYTGNIIRAIQLAFVIDKNLNFLPRNISLHYRYHILEIIISIADKSEPTQTMSFVNSVLLSKSANPAILHLCMEIVTKATKQRMIMERKLPKDENVLTMDAMFSLLVAQNTIEKGENIAVWFTRQYLTVDSDNFDLDLVYYLDNADAIRHFKYLTQAFIQNLELAMELVKIARTENDITFRMNEMDYRLITTNPDAYYLLTIKNNNKRSFVQLLPRNYIHVGGSEDITFKMVALKSNIFWWDREFNNAQGEIVYFSASKKLSEKVSGPMKINIKLQSPLKHSIIHVQLSGRDFRTWIINIKPNFTLQTAIIGEDLTAYIGYKKPNRYFIERHGIHVKREHRSYFFARKTPMYIGVLLIGNVTQPEMISLKFVGLKCLAWHGDIWEWSNKGCRVTSKQLGDDFVSCKCKMHSLFAADYQKPSYWIIPNKRKRIKHDVMHSFFIPKVALILLLIFAILLLIAYMKNKNFRKTHDYIFLKDNDIEHTEIYLIGVQTGIWKNSGTTSKVAIQVAGKSGLSKVHLLNIFNKKVLQRNSTDCFVMLTKACLGEILYIHLWHDYYGERPEWFCDTVIIRHFESGDRYIFLVSRWFSLLRKPYTIEGIFTPHFAKGGPFSAKLAASIRANHNYLSFLTQKRTPSSCTEQLGISFISIISMMAVCTVLLNQTLDFKCVICVISIAVAVGAVVTIILDVLFRNSQYMDSVGLRKSIKRKRK